MTYFFNSMMKGEIERVGIFLFSFLLNINRSLGWDIWNTHTIIRGAGKYHLG